MKLQTDQIVDVTVTSVQVFGLFCQYDGDTDLLVLIPEISWTASFCSCEQIADVGDTVTVKIIAIDESSGKIAGSMRQRFPDPWKTDTLDAGQSHTANVVRHVKSADRCDDGPAFLLEIVPGALVMLCTSQLELVAGDTCDVTIVESKPDAHAIKVKHASAG